MFDTVATKLKQIRPGKWRLWAVPAVLLMSLPFQALANTAPVITSTPDTKVTEDNQYTYEIIATDEDGDALNYAVSTLPTFLSYNSSTHTITGTPTNTDVGFHDVRVVITDGLQTVEQHYSLEVVNANDAPVLISNIDNQSILEDEPFTLSVASVFKDDDANDTLTYTADNLPSGLSLSSEGQISGAPDNSAALESPFTVKITVTDSAKASASTLFQIVVTNVNDAPEPFDDEVLVSEDSSVVADIIANDRDIDNELQPSTLFVVTTPVHGRASIDTGTGLLTYTPDADFAGTDTLKYRLTDPGGLAGTATVTFNVVNTNDAPIANNDVATTEEDTLVDIDVLANDTDIDEGDAPQGSQIIIQTTPSNGSVNVSDGKIQYTPATNFTGTDSFTYKVADSNGAFSDTANVTVTVGAINDVPVAGDDVAATLEDTSVLFAVLNNDSDTEDTSINVGSMAILNEPSHGIVAINSDGTMTYTPEADFNGTDTFDYTVTDSDGLTSAAATVTITVNPVNDSPIANNDEVTVDEDNSVEINVLGNDYDIDSTSDIKPGTLEITTQPQHGKLVLDTTTGVVRYTPTADYNGSDGFSYTVDDNGTLTSNVADVTITITPVNDSPRLVDDSATTDEDTAIVLTVLDNDADIDGTLKVGTLTITQQPASGTLSQDNNGNITYTPKLNFHGTDQFSYNIADDKGLQSTADATVLLTINSINDAPVALSGNASTLEDKTTEITLQGTDVDEDSLSFTIVQPPTHGSLSGNGKTKTYLPEANYHGSDSFTFKASDGKLDSNTTTVEISVISVNDRPVAIAQSTSMDEDSSISIAFSGTDIDGDPLTFRLAGGNISGTISGSPPVITYRPAENFFGEETLLFIANDGKLDSAAEVVTIEVRPVNDDPVADDQQLYLDEDSSADLTLSASDIDEDALSFNILTQPEHGTLSGTAPNLSYYPNPDYFGNDSFTFNVNDGTTDSNTATVSFDVSPTPDAPTATAQSVAAEEDQEVAITLGGNDPDGNTLSYQLVSLPARGTLFGTAPNLTYHGDANVNGSDSFQFKVSDGSLESEPATVTININPVNDPPVAVDDSYSMSMAGVSWLTLDVLANDTDLDGDSLILRSADSDLGSVAIVDNRLRFVPEPGFTGDVMLHYLMSDPAGESDRATVRLTVADNSTPQDPVVTPPANVSVIATGRLTKVALGTATAMDSSGNIIPVALVGGNDVFAPGSHRVFWKATDGTGRSAVASQRVDVFPQVSLSPGQRIEEGTEGTVKVRLNGPAPSYPVIVPYTVSGSATEGIDYELPSGSIRIDSGVETTLHFSTVADGIPDDHEDVIITLGDTPYRSQESTYRGEIVEGNIAPRVNLFAEQNGERRLVIQKSTAPVTVYADIVDGNAADHHTLEWLTDGIITRTNAPTDPDFQFSSETLNPGIYRIGVRVTDDHTDRQSVENHILMVIVDNLPPLGYSDSDGDLLSDAAEGYNDQDQDNLPDYLDAQDDCALLPERLADGTRYQVEGQSNGCLRLGPIATAGGEGGMLIDPAMLPQDPDTQNVGGLFDFEVRNLDAGYTSYSIVLPLRQPIPADAMYRKYSEAAGWTTFIQNSLNRIQSAKAGAGVCPPPNDSHWRDGLNLGDWCVQLTIEDGGPNDDDGLKNGAISDPGGVAVALSGNHFPEATADSGEMTWNSSQTFDVLANDTDLDNDLLEIVSAQATLGSAEIIDGVLVSYTPPGNFVGDDKVKYSISDGHGGIASADLTVTITGNSAPSVVNDNASTTNDKAIVVDVLGNDSDSDGDTLTLTSVTADIGTVEITAEQKVKYTPKAGHTGTATVTYQVSDGKGGISQGKLYVSVQAPVVTTPTQPSNNSGSSSGGGGSLGWGLIIMLVMAFRRQRI